MVPDTRLTIVDEERAQRFSDIDPDFSDAIRLVAIPPSEAHDEDLRRKLRDPRNQSDCTEQN